MSDGEITIGGDSADIPNGTYPGKVDTIEVRPGVKFEGDFRVWTFALDNGSSVSGTSSMATSQRSKGGRWIKNLLGRKPNPGEKVTLSGRPCMVVVEEEDGWPKVADVLPPVAQAAAPTEDKTEDIGDLPF